MLHHDTANTRSAETTDSKAISEPVRAFLTTPLNRPVFDPFFRCCLEVTIGYLRYLQRRGFHLPLEQYASDNPTRDLAIEILGSLLACHAGVPCGIVFDYYQREGFEAFAAASEDELHYYLTVLIRSFVRQELSKLRKLDDPQIENLKRRVGDILKNPQFIVTEAGSSPGLDKITLATTMQSELDRCAPWLQNELFVVVELAYQESHNRGDWCRKIFVQIGQDRRFAGWVYRHQLIAAMIEVCKLSGLIEAPPPAALESTDHGLEQSHVRQALAETRKWLEGSLLADFVAKGRLSPVEARRFVEAFDLIVTEGANHGTLDKLPAYFRAVMPKETHERYLHDYKYLFESAIKAGLQFVAEILKQ